MNVKEMTIEELRAECFSIRDKNEHWASCQDGSHGMALHCAGLTYVLDELQFRGVSEYEKV